MQQDNVQRTQSLPNVISNECYDILCEYIRMNLTFIVSREVITQRASAAIFKIMGTTYWGHELDLARSNDIIDRMTIQLTICYIVLCPTGTEPLSSTVFEIFA